MTITKQKIKLETQNFTCSNPKCRKAFANPIIVQNLSSEDTASYYGCPYCLTEIEETPKGDEIRQKPKAKRSRIEQTKTPLTETKPTQELFSETQKCPHHFGYLSQRPRGQEIPEECMICKKIIECMRKLTSNSSTPIEAEVPTVKEGKEPTEKTVKKSPKKP